jgi:hypothetical protein
MPCGVKRVAAGSVSACAARACEAPLRRGCAQHYVRGSAAQSGGPLRGWARAQEGEGSTVVAPLGRNRGNRFQSIHGVHDHYASVVARPQAVREPALAHPTPGHLSAGRCLLGAGSIWDMQQ